MANDVTISIPADGMRKVQEHWSSLGGLSSMEDFRKSRLIPAGDMAAVRNELARAAKRCDMGQAAQLGETLLGSYPNHNSIPDPVLYARGITAVLMEYPYPIGMKAIDLLTRRLRFLPTRADLVEELEKLMGALRWAQFIVDRTEDERRRRRKEFVEREASEAGRASFRAKYGGKSPADVLRERGLLNFDSKGKDHAKTSNEGSDALRASGGSDEHAKRREGDGGV